MAAFHHLLRGLLVVGLATGVANAKNLPSGLAPLTQVSVSGAEVALDSNGNLFRSSDGGEHWKGVKPQWAGKAVELLGVPGLALAPPAQGAAATYAAILLRSTTALHWVSVDGGKTWLPSTLDDVRRNDVKWSGN